MTAIHEETTVKTKSLKDIICNICRKSCMGGFYTHEYMKFQADWGYATNLDTQSWDGHLCENCATNFKKWIESCGGKIDVSNYI